MQPLRALLVLAPAVAPFQLGDAVPLAPLLATGLPSSQEVEGFEPPPTAATVWSRPQDRPPDAAWWSETLPAGGWRFAYRFQRQTFDGLRDGRDDISSDNAESRGYAEIPEEMTWTTHTFELSYGIEDRTTAFVSLPWVQKDLDGHENGGDGYSQSTDGIGDAVIGVVRQFRDNDRGGHLVAHLGLGLPTGSTDEKDSAPGGGKERLSYPMQLGTGTVHLLPGVYWIQPEGAWTWGVGARWRVHLDDNDEGYAPGDTALFQAWASRALGNDLVGTLRLSNSSWGDYHREDDRLDPDQSPLNDEHRQGGNRTDVSAGLAWELGGNERANRFELELGVPVDEWLDGPQMSTDWLLSAGWRFSF